MALKFDKILGKIRERDAGDVTSVNGKTGAVTLDKDDVGLGNVDNTADTDKPVSTAQQSALDLKLDASEKGANSGVAELDSGGKVPSAQLPSYVDDVEEYANAAALPGTGETGKIYVTLDNNLTYRWSGSAYVEISASLALGETSSTAYRGDRGKTAYDHSQLTSGNPHSVSKSDVGLGNVDNTADTAKPVSTAQQAALDDKQDILAEGAFADGDKTKLDGIETGADVTDETNVQANQGYAVFIYNSGGSQSGNRFNDWSDLMTAIARQEGAKTIYFEQDETIPTGSWNLDYVTLRGNGVEYNSGGYTITFGDNTTISSWLVPSVHSLRLLSTSTTGHICTFTSSFTIAFENVSNVQSSTSYEFFASSASNNIIALRNSARLQIIGTSIELFRFTGTNQTVILSRGEGAVVNDDIFASDNTINLLIDIIASVALDPSTWPSTHTSATINTTFPLNQTDARALGFDNSNGSLSATTVQGAIDEIADDSDAYTPTNVTADRAFDANSTTLDEIADVLGTLIGDLQDRGIIG